METATRELALRLQPSLRGRLIVPEDRDYPAARKLYNGMIDKKPAAIVRCADVADVMAAVRFARDQGMLLSVRGGGHNGAGLGSCDNGLSLDLSLMRSVQVVPGTNVVRVEGGAVWGDVDHATHPFGLAVPAGIISTTGVGGLTLGGGHGYLTRKYGLTIDNLLEADVVLADGTLVRASDTENEDLFWAIRGGGGNFGIVTSFVFEGKNVREVFAGPTLWPIERAKEVLSWYREFSPRAPDDLYGFFAFMMVPPGPPFPEAIHNQAMCGVVWCYTGPVQAADHFFEPVRKLKPAFEHLGVAPYPMFQQAFDALLPSGLQWYWKGHFVEDIDDAAIDVHLDFGTRLPTPLSTMHLYPIDGAAGRVGRTKTAFSHRDAKWSMVIAGIGQDASDVQGLSTWAKEYWQALAPHCAPGGYVNFMMEEGQDRVKATYRENYERLAAIKKIYDPTNLFCVNQNIKPAA